MTNDHSPALEADYAPTPEIIAAIPDPLLIEEEVEAKTRAAGEQVEPESKDKLVSSDAVPITHETSTPLPTTQKEDGLEEITKSPPLNSETTLQGDTVDQGENVAINGEQDSTVAPEKEHEDETVGGASPSSHRLKPDSEFLERAQINNEDAKAEWRYDTSDADSSDSSSSSSSSDSSSDESDDSDDLLEPEEQMRMLMAEIGEEGDDAGAATRKHPKEMEKPEPIWPKPDFIVTDDMAIIELGDAETVMGQHVLIKARVVNGTRVLDQGSALCLADRTVIGAISDTLGKVAQPLYVVGFESAEEAKSITAGTTIYYVEQRANFADVAPLLAQKHYDTVNALGEEINPEDEDVFSDDEMEAEFKSKAKYKKKFDELPPPRRERQNIKPFKSQRSMGIGSTQPGQVQYPGDLDYDEGAGTQGDNHEDGDGTYNRLARPDNLQELMASGRPPPIEGRFHSSNRGGRPPHSDNRDGRYDGSRRGRGDRGGRAGVGSRGGSGAGRGRASDDSRRGNRNSTDRRSASPRPRSGGYDGGSQDSSRDRAPPETSMSSNYSQYGSFAPQQLFPQQPMPQMMNYGQFPNWNMMPTMQPGAQVNYGGMMNGNMPMPPIPPQFPNIPNMMGLNPAGVFNNFRNNYMASMNQQHQQQTSFVPPPPPMQQIPPIVQQPAVSHDPRLQARQAAASAPVPDPNAALNELLRNIEAGSKK